MLAERLCQIGLTESEAKIYLELLKIGPQAVSVIARKADLNRTTTYSILKSLERKGFVASFLNTNVKYFTANDPNCLVAFVDQKCQTYDSYRDEILRLVPDFRKLTENYSSEKPTVSYLDGMEGVKYVLYDVLKEKKDFCEFLPLHKWLSEDLIDFCLKFVELRVKETNLRLRAIVPDKKEVRDFFKKYYNLKDGLTELIYVPDGDFSESFQSQLIIYGNKVANIYLEKNNRYAVLIESKEIAMRERGIFDILWKWFNKNAV